MKRPDLPRMPKLDLHALVQDFRTLDPKDPGNWAAAPRVVILLALLAAIIAAGWWFDWRGQWEELETKRRQEEQLKKDFITKKSQAINLDEYRKQLAEIDRAFGTLLQQLPNRSQMEALIVDINQAGLGRGLQFELFKPGSEVSRDFYAELPINITLRGSYHDLGNFAGDVAHLGRIVTLRDVRLYTEKDKPDLKLQGVAVTYRYLDEEELAQKRAEERKAGDKNKKGAKK